MEDQAIIELYWNRDEAAIRETDAVYGNKLQSLSEHILDSREDARECVNDTYHTTWNQIPPTRPDSFKAFLGRIVRNFAISKYRALHAKKRFNGLEVMLSEIGDCIPATESVEQEMEAKELTEYINSWLADLKQKDRVLFVRRYWYGDEVKDLARKCGVSGTQMTQRMLRLRRKLKEYLTEKGVVL